MEGRTPSPAPPRWPQRKDPSLASLRAVFRAFIWPRRKILGLGLLLIAVNRACALVLPGLPKYLIDDVVGHDRPDRLAPLLGVATAAVAFQALSSFGLTQLLSVEAQRLIAELRIRVQAHVMRLPIGYFDSTKSGTVVSRILHDVEGVRNLVGTGLVQLIGGILVGVGALWILLSISPVLVVVALAPMAVFGLISIKAFGWIRPIFRERSRLHSEVSGRLTEAVGGIRVIKGFHAEEREERTFSEGVFELFANIRRSLVATSLVQSSAVLLLGLGSVLLGWFGGRMMLAGELEPGAFISFWLYLALLVTPIVQMANIGTQVTEALAGLDRTDEILRLPREEGDPRRTHRLDGLRGDLRFERVGFAYEPGKPVLFDISFLAPAGSVTALVGTSGSGKTTIAGLAASFLHPGEGRVLADGVDLAQVELSSYRRHLGVVLQTDFLFEGTIRENVLYGRPGANGEEVRAAVVAAHVHEFADQFENGLDTLIGERGVKLSGGQRQRVSIARALLADPRVLILDEATSSLDTESEALIQTSLATLMRGRTTIVIAHRLSTIRKADRILVLEKGRLLEQGTHDELMALGGRYHDLATMQARI